MKRFFAIVLSAGLLLSLFNSCRVEESNKTPDAAGMKMFAAWEGAYVHFDTEFMEIAFQFNQWLQSADSMPNAYCLGYTVQPTSDENTWKLMSGENTLYFVETDGNLLDAAAHWTITKCKGQMESCYLPIHNQYNNCNDFDCFGYADEVENASFIQDNTRMDIQTIGTNKWRVQLITPEAWDEYGSVYADLTLTVPSQGVPAMLSEVEYELEGSGSFAFVQDSYYNSFDERICTYAYMGFQIDEPLESAGDNSRFWKSGALSLRATNNRGYVTERTAHFAIRGGNYWMYFFVNGNPDEGETWCRQDRY